MNLYKTNFDFYFIQQLLTPTSLTQSDDSFFLFTTKYHLKIEYLNFMAFMIFKYSLIRFLFIHIRLYFPILKSRKKIGF